MSNSSRANVCLFLAVTLLSSLTYAASADRITGPIDSSHVVQLARSLHPKAQPKYDRGAADPSLRLGYMTLVTTPSATQQTALTQLLADLQDPSSANYHKWLTPAQYADRFGLSQNDMSRVTNWLKSNGFQVQSIGGGRNTVVFSGTATQVQNAFKAEIHQYDVNGEEHFANSTPVMIPAALQGIVTGVRGLNSFRMHSASQHGVGSGPRVRPNYYDGSFVFKNFLAPGDVATIYGFSSLSSDGTIIDGTGESIAVIGETDIFLSDINDFRSGFGLPSISASNCTSNTTGAIASCDDPHFKYVLIGTDPGAPDSIQDGDIGEADLDVEWSGAVAPNAQIIYVNAPDPSGNGVDDSLAAAINPSSGPPVAPIITMSYGLCEAEATILETELEQAAAEGITVVNSSGDSGSAACDDNPQNANPPFDPAVGGLAVNYPASSIYVIAAGGTAITLADDSYPSAASSYWNTTNAANGGTARQYIPETPWNDDEEFADYCHSPVQGDTFCSSGGGTSGWVALGTSATAQQVQQDIWIYEGGGGASNCFGETMEGVCTSGISQPTWQQDLVITTPHTSGVRWLPDVSFLASPEFPGYIYCTPLSPDTTPADYTSTCASGIFDAVDQNESLVGGTSVASPVFAGILALLNQYLAGPSSPGLGDIHSMLYRLAATPTNHAFNQVTTGDNLAYCDPGQPSNQTSESWIICPNSGVFGYSASGAGNFDPTTGYNLVAGLGSVNVANLATAWAATRSATTLTVSPSATQVSTGQSVTFTATLSATTAVGNISFSNSNNGGASTSLGIVALTTSDDGVATFATSTLPMGANVITASFGGDSSNGASTATAQTVTVTAPFSISAAAATPASVSAGQTATSMITVTPNGGFNSPVTITCPTPPAGLSCPNTPLVVTPNGGAAHGTLSILTLPNMATGAQTVTVSATGGGATVTTTVPLTVTATTETFTLSAPSATYSVTPGQAATVNVTVASTNGFVTGSATVVPLTYTCSGAPSEANCTISPSTATTETGVTVSITTTAPTGELRRPFDRGSRIFYAALLPGLLGIVFTFGSRNRASRLHGMRMLGLILVLGFSTLWLGSCSGSNNSSSSNAGTPPGSYTITINATTGGANPVTSQLQITLAVQ
ncbi:MAG TPA: protease pro-enzyme activation domain-containing protein [Terriglobales bacterium]|nr:protease pro-enzyme activation domain-containing protein [Terriglobales bacterium]